MLMSMLSQADGLKVGDSVTLTVQMTGSKVDFTKPVQWRDYDLLCTPPKGDHLDCIVVAVHKPT